MKKRNSKYYKIAFWVCLGVSIVLMVGGAIVPPPFVIDATIFKAVGWLFAYAALAQIPGLVSEGKQAILQHGNTSITIKETSEDELPTEQEPVEELHLGGDDEERYSEEEGY